MTVFLKNLDLSKLQPKRKVRTGRKPLNPFPVKLYKMLMDLAAKGKDDIASWGPDGASFLVHDTQRLVSEALPAYFNQTKYKSFQRQLNFYGFERIMDGPLEGSYCHPMFRKGHEELSHKISRKEHQQAQFISSQPRIQITTEDIIIPERTAEEEQEVEFFNTTQSKPQYNRVSFTETETRPQEIVIPTRTLEEVQEEEFFNAPKPRYNRGISSNLVEPTSLLFQESIISLPPGLKSQQSSMFMLPPHLSPQESILANGHTAHNFGKSFFFVESGNNMDDTLAQQQAAV